MITVMDRRIDCGYGIPVNVTAAQKNGCAAAFRSRRDSIIVN